MNRSLLILLVFLFPLYSFGQTFTVDDNGPADFNNIQDAVLAASDTDEVVIADGIYTGYGNRDIDFYGKAITVRSQNGPENCIIDCNASEFDPHRGFIFQNNEGSQSVLKGLTIKNGHISEPMPGRDWPEGGGIWCFDSSPTITGCIITNNRAYKLWAAVGYGAGIYCQGGAPTITDCTVMGNILYEGAGAGIYCCYAEGATISQCHISDNRGIWESSGGGLCVHGDVRLESCLITRNDSGWGGGIRCSGNLVTIANCEITNNWVWVGTGGGIDYTGNPIISGCLISNNDSIGDGGGIYCYASGAAVINNCVIVQNQCGYDGAGIYGGNPLVTNVVINSNFAHGNGGGLAFCHGIIANCVIVGNYAGPHNGNYGGAFYDCDGVITNCTIVGNCAYASQVSPQSYGAGMYDCNGTISNCIIWGNRASLDPQVCSCCDPNYCCIQDFTGGGTANINSDPCFAVAGCWDDAGTPDDANDDFWVGGDYHLKSAFGRWDSVKQSWVYDDVNSPGIDAGDQNSDWTAEFWPHGKRINIGAYGGTTEASMSSSYLGNAADLNNDANVDMTDYSLLAAKWRLGQARTIPPANITVDGDLVDWTGHIEWIPLDKTYFGQPDDILNAKFALRWNRHAGKIYAAVIVDDNDHVFTDEYISWDAGDRIEVYSQGDAEGGTGFWDPEHPNWDSAQQYMTAPDTAGGTWATWGNAWPLGPDVGLEYAAVVDANRIIYEIGVKQFDNYGTFSGDPTVETDLHFGHTVGFDIVADTRWTGGFGMLSENLMMDKFKNGDSFAKYVLTDRYSDSLYGPLIGDIDRNQVVDISDVYTLAQNWLAQD